MARPPIHLQIADHPINPMYLAQLQEIFAGVDQPLLDPALLAHLQANIADVLVPVNNVTLSDKILTVIDAGADKAQVIWGQFLDFFSCMNGS